MSPIDMDSLRSHALGEQITTERGCADCGYNLVGLKIGAICPECGCPIRRMNRKESPMQDAPLGWILRFRVGSSFMLLSGVALTLTLVFSSLAGNMVVLLAFGAALMWVVSVFLVTQPRPRVASHVEPQQEWFVLRTITRTTQVLWLALPFLFFMSGSPGLAALPSALVVVLTIALGGIAILGLSALLIYLSNLAHWASDSDLFYRLRTTAWILGVPVPFLMIAYEMLMYFGRTSTAARLLAGIVLVAFLLSLICTLAMIGRCLLSLHRVAHWTAVNRRTADARNQRLREKAARAASGR